MRIGVAGIHIESSTFSPHRSTVDDFRVTRGAELLARYEFLAPGKPLTEDVEWVPLLHAVALPGGAVTEPAYVELAREIYQRLRAAGPLDGGVDQDLLRIGHHHIDRPTYPFDMDIVTPQLTATSMLIDMDQH